MGSAKADFQMVARKVLTSCEALDGKRVAIQSREGTTGALARNWFSTSCPNTRPNIMIIPGSENRVAGLIAGQLDAAPVDLQNTAQLLQLRPDNFGVIRSFGESVQLVGSVYYASTDWLQKNEKTIKEFVSTYVDVLKEAQRESAPFKETLYGIQPDAPRPVLDKVLEGWLAQDIYIPVKGVQPEMIDFAIQFYGKVRPYRTIKSAADVATTDYLPASPN
jgi:NitT/TauT family transport system substrate-binding protein